MGFFSSNNIFTAKQMKWKDYKNSPATKDERITDTLDEPAEVRELYNGIQEQIKKRGSGGGATPDDVRKALGVFRKGHGHDISVKESKKLAQAFFPHGKKYIFESEKKVSKPSGTANPVKEAKNVAGGSAASLSKSAGKTAGFNMTGRLYH